MAVIIKERATRKSQKENEDKMALGRKRKARTIPTSKTAKEPPNRFKKEFLNTYTSTWGLPPPILD